jgi:hypothetical protein
MLKREDRARKVAEWLEHLQAWKDSGESLSAYARKHGLTVWSAYHWRGVLTREGSWREGPKAPGRSRSGSPAVSSSRVPLRFARVNVSDMPRAAPLVLRVQLANGRRAEIAVEEIEQLGAVLSVLERSA